MRLLKIGSSPDCDIVLNSRRVSALHAEMILLNNGDILLEDKGSTNGTFVNNQPIKQGASVPVRRGDLIRFADMELQWSSVPQPSNNSMFKKIYGIGSNMRYNDIQVTGNTVSRFHATLKIDKNGRAFIEDHSLNGTSINGKRIPAHQNVRVKRGDDVVVGGVPIDLKPYIKGDVGGTILKSLAGVAAVAAVVLIVLFGPWHRGGNPTLEELMHATPCVIGAYYVDLTLEDDPFKEMFPGLWPSTWRFGYNRTTGKWELDNPNPATYNGTAFFISENGELATNRHVAVPWEMMLSSTDRTNIETQVFEYVAAVIRRYEAEKQDVAIQNTLMRLAGYDVVDYSSDLETEAIMHLLRNAKPSISGHHEYLGILLPGHYYRTVADLKSCQVIAESGDPKVDVALIRMNDPHTPKELEGKYFYLENARLDETTIKITEPITTIGYPYGETAAYDIGNGLELSPSHSTSSISKRPDYIKFQIQKVSKGGESGSPVIDSKRNLIGMVYSTYNNSELTYACNIKHLVKLFEENKYRK